MKISIYVNDSYANKDSKSRVYLRIFLNNKYVKIPLDVYIHPSGFDIKKQKITKGGNKWLYNQIINDAIGRASKIALKYSVNNKALTPQIIKEEFKKPGSTSDFYKFLDAELEITREKKTANTYKNHFWQLNKIKKFKKSLTFNDIDEEYINGLYKHLKYKEHNKQSSINQTLTILRRYVNIAIRKEFIEKSPFDFYEFKSAKSQPDFLDQEELNILIDLYNKKILSPPKQKSLRYFLFGSQTGMRISDIRIVKYEQIKSGILEYTPEKTKENKTKVFVPLTEFAKTLMQDENPNKVKGLIFNCTKYSNMYQRLVEVVEFSGMRNDITFHTARHTFATMFLKKSKKANGLIVLQKLLGHSKIETTMVYAHVINNDIVEAMAEFEI